MSVDPAILKTNLPEGTLTLEAFTPDSDAVFVFDFDGVLIAPDEDDLYALPAGEGEQALLDHAAKAFGLFLGTPELRYRRHILYQAAAAHLGLEMEEGPAFDFYRQVAKSGRAMVLTARSGFYAVERVTRFLRDHGCLPVELFAVGRVGKALQLQLLCREYPDHKIVFVEDNAAHLSSAAALGLENLVLVHVPRPKPAQSEADLRAYLNDVLSRAIKSFH